jgi:hypothetical protein
VIGIFAGLRTGPILPLAPRSFRARFCPLIPARPVRRDPGSGLLARSEAAVPKRSSRTSDAWATHATLTESAIDEGAGIERFAQAIAKMLWAAIQSGAARECS